MCILNVCFLADLGGIQRHEPTTTVCSLADFELKQSTSQHFPMEGLPVLSCSAMQGRNPKLLWSSNHLMALNGFPTIEPNLLLASALFMKDKPRICCSG